MAEVFSVSSMLVLFVVLLQRAVFVGLRKKQKHI